MYSEIRFVQQPSYLVVNTKGDPEHVLQWLLPFAKNVVAGRCASVDCHVARLLMWLGMYEYDAKKSDPSLPTPWEEYAIGTSVEYVEPHSMLYVVRQDGVTDVYDTQTSRDYDLADFKEIASIKPGTSYQAAMKVLGVSSSAAAKPEPGVPVVAGKPSPFGQRKGWP